jgi:hypothetical protein
VRDIRHILKTPMAFLVELTIATGETFKIEHPAYTYMHPDSGELWHFPKDGPIAVIDPAHIVKVQPKGRPLPF